MSPLDIATVRVFFGAVTLLALFGARYRTQIAGAFHSRTFPLLIISSLLASALPYTLLAFGETRTATSNAGMLNSTVPLFSAMITPWVLKSDRLGATRRLGVVGGLIGLLVVFAPWNASLHPGSRLGDLAVVVAALIFGYNWVLQKKYFLNRGLPAAALATIQLSISAIVLVIVDFHGLVHLDYRAVGPLSVVVLLGVLNTGLAAVASLRLTKTVPPSVASGTTNLAALVSVIIGVVVLGEHLELHFVLGALITLVALGLLGYGDRISPRVTVLFARLRRVPQFEGS